MGTNFYLHLGKRSSQGEGNRPLFSEASDVAAIEAEVIVPGWVTDEHGKEMTWAEFLALWRECEREVHYGENFG